MLVIEEIGRVLGQILGFTIATRRILLLFVLVAAAVILVLSITVATMTPVAIYPFI